MTNEMKLRLGQRLAVGFDGSTVPQEYVDLIREYKIGNVILFRRNVESFEQLKKLCGDLRKLIWEETGAEPFIMIDEESGSVSRLAHIAAPTPSAMAIGATDDPENAYRIGKIIGDELNAVGINFNLAPVLDCFTNPDGTASGNRCFGVSPQKVTEFGLEYIRGLQDSGILACGKHFPGHGDTTVDSHLALPVVDKAQDEVRRVELVSFKAAIEHGIDGIMSAHVVFPAFEPERVPSTVSRKVMTGLLREELGFKGILLSDGMEMKAVMDMFGIEEATRRALAAGVDVALICHSAQQAASTMEYIGKAVEEGKMNLDEIEEHYRFILSRKAQLEPSSGDANLFGSEEQCRVARSILQSAVKVLNAPDGQPLPKITSDTLFFGLPHRAASQASDALALNAAKTCAETFGAQYIADLDRMPDPACVKTAVVILDKKNDSSALIDAANALANAGVKVIAVSMSTTRPLDFLADKIWKICAWQYDALSLDVLVEFLKTI